MKLLPACTHRWVDEFHEPSERRIEIVCLSCLTTLAWIADGVPDGDIDLWRVHLRERGILR